MKKGTIKSHLLIGNKLLGTLLYSKDILGRGYLKFSFKNAIADFVTYSKTPTSLPTLPKATESSHLEISYKFQSSHLATKRLVGKKTEKGFYKIELPFKNCLFVVRIKDWQLLDDDANSPNPLVLPVPTNPNQNIAVIFSFLDGNGNPLKPPQLTCKQMGSIDLPEKNLKKFCIGICDDTDNNEPQNLTIELFK